MSRDYFVGNRTYDFLKVLTTLVLPAVGTLYFTLASIWGLPFAEEFVGSITALVTFLGVVMKMSDKSYNSSDSKYDGTVVVNHFIDEDQLESSRIKINLNDGVYVDRLDDHKELRLKVDSTTDQ